MLVALLAMALAALAASPAGERAFAQDVPTKSWDFERFDVAIEVNADGSLSVTETQVVNFRGSFRFLNRDLAAGPARFEDGRSYGRVRYKDIEVFDIGGKPWDDYKVEGIKGGKRVRIEFSAADRQMGWVVKYKMTGAIIYAGEYDRLYFNTVTFDRSVPVKKSRVRITLPSGTDMSEVRSAQYPSEEFPPDSVKSGRDDDVLWWETVNIAPYSTLTIDVAFPKGSVRVPLAFRPGFGAVMITLAALLALGSTAFMAFRWHRKGRDVSPAELDVVRYQAPDDLRPAEVGYLVRQRPNTGDLTATIVDLAIRKKLVINEEEGSGLLKRGKFSFQRWQAAGEDVAPFERELLDGLFDKGDYVKEDDLKNRFYEHVSTIHQQVKDSVLAKGLFDGDPGRVRSYYYFAGAVLLALIGAVIALNIRVDVGYGYVFIPSFAVSGLAVIGFGRYMPRRTPAGSERYSYVMGFKEYMSTAEREEMALMSADNFQSNLPYAMVLGVADKWAGKFKDIYTSPPDWYRGYYPGAFSTVYLADSLSRMETSVGSTLTSSPSSGGGGGGFGGGSSGGGFGGGGSSAG